MDGINIVEYKEPDMVGDFGSVRVGNDQYILRNKPTFEACPDGTFKIGRFEKVPELYLCDPDKNTECKKTSCQVLCKHTTNKAFEKNKEEDKDA